MCSTVAEQFPALRLLNVVRQAVAKKSILPRCAAQTTAQDIDKKVKFCFENEPERDTVTDEEEKILHIG